MQRRFIDILFFLFAVILCVQVEAQDPKGAKKAESKKEEFDCTHDDITDSWFCNSGPLEGREFVNKSELDEAIEAYKEKAKAANAERPNEQLPPDPKAPAEEKADVVKAEPGEPRLKVMSWNMKALAGEDSDYDRAAMVLGKADVVALQEVDLRGQGKGFINVIANLIQAKTQEKICRAWIHSDSGERLTLGFLWKASTIGFVESDGGILESCGDTASVIRQTKKSKLVSQATFYFKPQKKMFVFSTAYLSEKPKAPEKSVNEMFKAIDEAKWPIVLAGDLKMNPANPAFAGSKKQGFRAAMKGGPKGWDNVWYRGAVLTDAGPVDLYRQFKDARKEDIKRGFGEISPVMAEFNLRVEEAPSADTLAVVSKKAPLKKKSKDKKVAKAKSKSN